MKCAGLLAIVCTSATLITAGAQKQTAPVKEKTTKTYLGFDRNVYPGDDALPILRKNFSFAGYWLSPPPGETANSWTGKRVLLLSHGFGFAVLFRARPVSELKAENEAIAKGTEDGRKASSSAAAEGFGPNTIIFLDIEEGGRLPAAFHAYLRAWVDELSRAGYRPGAYCSGMPVNEGGGISITTAEDMRDHFGSQRLTYWVYNDQCPPSPGCLKAAPPPPPSASGVPYADVWQFAQSPRRKEFAARCAGTYRDNNCYAEGDTTHRWFLDLNAARTPNPSGGAKAAE